MQILVEVPNEKGYIARSRDMNRLLDEPGPCDRWPIQKTHPESLPGVHGRVAHLS
jgi:hypothetical protein